MERNTDYLTVETTDQLQPYQIDSLNRTICDYIHQNEESRNIVWKKCPKCGAVVNGFGKGGYTKDAGGNRKKPMLKCPECHRRFVADHGQLTWYSHSDDSVWDKLIKDTADGKSINATAADIDRHPVTVFYMRHKFLAFIECLNESEVVSNVAEADETYPHECHKGLVPAYIDEANKVITLIQGRRKKTSPGLGKDKACITTVVQRQGGAYIHTENMGKPSSENLKCLDSHIDNGTYVFTDGNTAYEKVLTEKQCPFKELKSSASYDAVNHLNNANSLHSRIKKWLNGYRNVNTIYTNRYNALFSLRHKYSGEDAEEMLTSIKRELHQKVQYFFRRQIQENIFDDPAAMEARAGLVGVVHINWLRYYEDYQVQYQYCAD